MRIVAHLNNVQFSNFERLFPTDDFIAVPNSYEIQYFQVLEFEVDAIFNALFEVTNKDFDYPLEGSTF